MHAESFFERHSHKKFCLNYTIVGGTELANQVLKKSVAESPSFGPSTA